MKRIILLLLLTPMAHAWDVSEHIDEMDDSHTTMATVKDGDYSLTVMCDVERNIVHPIYVVFKGEVIDEIYSVLSNRSYPVSTVRFDKGKAKKYNWPRLGYDTIDVVNRRKIIKEMLKAETMLMRVTTHGDSSRTAKFSVVGLADALTEMGCTRWL